jgi:hypothetical protein
VTARSRAADGGGPVLLIRPDAKVNRAASSSSLADVRARSLALDVSGAGASGGEAAGRARVYSDEPLRRMSPFPTYWTVPAEGSIKAPYPPHTGASAKIPDRKRRDLRRFCRAL